MPITCSEDHHAGSPISTGTRVHLVNTSPYLCGQETGIGIWVPPSLLLHKHVWCRERSGDGSWPWASQQRGRSRPHSERGWHGDGQPSPVAPGEDLRDPSEFLPRRLVWDQWARSQTERQDHEIRLCLSRLLGTSGILTIL